MTPDEKQLMLDLVDEYLDPKRKPKNKDKPSAKSAERLGINALAIVLDQLHSRPAGMSAFLMQCGRFAEALKPKEKKETPA